jgi:hypothetical protein
MNRLFLVIACMLGIALMCWLLWSKSIVSRVSQASKWYWQIDGQGSDEASINTRAIIAQVSGPARSKGALEHLDHYVANLEGLNASDKLHLLKDLANNHAGAAASLSRTLLRCRNLLKRMHALRARSELDLNAPDLNEEFRTVIRKQLQRELDEMNTECSGIDEQEALQGYAYFERAAELGDVETRAGYILGSRAMIDPHYAFKHPEAVIIAKQRALHYTHAAAMSGSVEAMERLADIHFSGAYSTANDPVKGTAYLMAAVQSGREQARGAMQRRLAQLDHTDAAAAAKMANDLLEQIAQARLYKVD